MVETIGRGADQFIIRFPDGLRARIKRQAALNRRSMNSEIVTHLEQAFPASATATEGSFADGPSVAAQKPTALPGGETINRSFRGASDD